MARLPRALGLFVLAVLLALTAVPTFAQQSNPWTSGVLNPPWYSGTQIPGHDH